jgi:putative ubiquitin-RnfH superfamily antitoxin RatB of RatAB toxin-antitoxin module
MKADDSGIPVDVCFSGLDKFVSVAVKVTPGASIADAITASGIDSIAEIADWRRLGLGVYGKRRRPDDLVQPGDRIELSRKLVADPKLARQRRVEKERSANKYAK